MLVMVVVPVSPSRLPPRHSRFDADMVTVLEERPVNVVPVLPRRRRELVVNRIHARSQRALLLTWVDSTTGRPFISPFLGITSMNGRSCTMFAKLVMIDIDRREGNIIIQFLLLLRSRTLSGAAVVRPSLLGLAVIGSIFTVCLLFS